MIVSGKRRGTRIKTRFKSLYSTEDQEGSAILAEISYSGARLEGIYPASIVLHGQALNITLVSYSGQLDFGIIACRRSLPHVQRLLDNLEESLQELEEAAGIAAD